MMTLNSTYVFENEVLLMQIHSMRLLTFKNQCKVDLLKDVFATQKKRFYFPKKWKESYLVAALECVIYTTLKDHQKNYKTLKGAPAIIEDVSTKFYRKKFWFCQDGDYSRHPFSEKYCSVLFHFCLK